MLNDAPNVGEKKVQDSAQCSRGGPTWMRPGARSLTAQALQAWTDVGVSLHALRGQRFFGKHWDVER